MIKSTKWLMPTIAMAVVIGLPFLLFLFAYGLAIEAGQMYSEDS